MAPLPSSLLAATGVILMALSVNGASYSKTDTIVGSDFYSAFNFENIPDPTHGRVNYVDGPTAQARNLTFASHDTFILRADHTNVLDPNGPGRDSVRIRSNKVFTSHVAVFNIRHMPEACASWPAVWETNESTWPNGGEIDILEGVNNQPPNAAVLHTNAGCTISGSRPMTGVSTGDNCDGDATGGAGCGVHVADDRSYGPAFNANGGGWYAVERTNEAIKVFFWPRDDPTVPSEVSGATTSSQIHTETWGTPSAAFPNTSCNIEEHFDEHNIIINLTLCGDWAGNVYQFSGCPSTCVDFVNNSPEGFVDAFFDFASITVFQ
ncbi:hypothetical protein HGRIS_012646 [Hohenbuehelia grisea]|uniref:GH16 domain-containing protein n=1 Tax=Hohenbuehelia grisea TaxID=104357 RepID=A0ABR3IT18_9AGAR